MDSASPRLRVVAYHYVRDTSRTRFPRLAACGVDRFRRQIDRLAADHELTTLERALAFLTGGYRPARDLVLLTFDDGLKEHADVVTPLLAERGIEGVFFLTTSCLDGHVAAVHKSHLLMADLEFSAYRAAFMRRLESYGIDVHVPHEVAERTYRWDTPQVAQFKYLLNFCLDTVLRNRVLDGLFVDHFGSEAAMARELYLDWDDARAMQASGMVIGGHTHTHLALAHQERQVQKRELATCLERLRARLGDHPHWPLAYPYGSSSDVTGGLVREAGFTCAFTVDPGENAAGDDLFSLCRFDTNDLPADDAERDPSTASGLAMRRA